MLTFTVYGDPQPQGSARAFVIGKRAVVTSDNPKLKGWRQNVAKAAQAALAPPRATISGPVRVQADFFLKRPQKLPKGRIGHTVRPDSDKLVRGLLDSLTGVVWKDDAQVVEIHARKQYHAEGDQPHATISITEVQP